MIDYQCDDEYRAMLNRVPAAELDRYTEAVLQRAAQTLRGEADRAGASLIARTLYYAANVIKREQEQP